MLDSAFGDTLPSASQLDVAGSIRKPRVLALGPMARLDNLSKLWTATR